MALFFGNNKVSMSSHLTLQEDTANKLTQLDEALTKCEGYATNLETSVTSAVDSAKIAKESADSISNLIKVEDGKFYFKDGTEWSEVKSGASLEIGDIGISLFVDESLGLRRYLNGSIMAITEQNQVFVDKLREISIMYPSLVCTEDEWQEIASNSDVGQCGKFVLDEDIGVVRLPNIVMPIQGLTDLTSLGEMVNAGLPNIEGNTGNPNSLVNYEEIGNTSGAFYVKSIESNSAYSNGTSGYRIWADGYCEQWGSTRDLNNASFYNLQNGARYVFTINLLKTYKDTGYNITSNTYFSGGDYGYNGLVGGPQKTNNSFVLGDYYGYGYDWITRGYLREGQY